jgi:hypothetical protein
MHYVTVYLQCLIRREQETPTLSADSFVKAKGKKHYESFVLSNLRLLGSIAALFATRQVDLLGGDRLQRDVFGIQRLL